MNDMLILIILFIWSLLINLTCIQKIFNLAIIKYFLYNNFRHIYMPG